MENKSVMPFGKKFRVGNFEYVKIKLPASRPVLKVLRNGVPVSAGKRPSHASVPYISVSTVGDGWSIRFIAGSMMYAAIEEWHVQGADGRSMLHNLFVMMYADTNVMGDTAYWQAKGEALQAFLKRAESARVSADGGDGAVVVGMPAVAGEEVGDDD